jgi:thiamine-monophosphate kinase
MSDSAGEMGFIAWLRSQIPTKAGVTIGPGDDAAALHWPNDRQLLITTDMLLEGSCFRLVEAGPRQVGRKAMAVNLSDIAAMAGVPRAAVISVGLPRQFGRDSAEELFLGVKQLADEFDVAIVGGDTNAWSGELAISVTMVGEATSRGPVCRSGANPGDWIFVTGPLGGSIRGHHLDFTPRVREALALHENLDVHAMIDISDGFSRDLHHICEASRCGAIIEANKLPISEAANQFKDGMPPLDHALSDGEDFELLFTVAREDGERLVAVPPKFPVFHVGYCVERGVWIEKLGHKEPLRPFGFEHRFGE